MSRAVALPPVPRLPAPGADRLVRLKWARAAAARYALMDDRYRALAETLNDAIAPLEDDRAKLEGWIEDAA